MCFVENFNLVALCLRYRIARYASANYMDIGWQKIDAMAREYCKEHSMLIGAVDGKVHICQMPNVAYN